MRHVRHASAMLVAVGLLVSLAAAIALADELPDPAGAVGAEHPAISWLEVGPAVGGAEGLRLASPARLAAAPARREIVELAGVRLAADGDAPTPADAGDASADDSADERGGGDAPAGEGDGGDATDGTGDADGGEPDGAGASGAAGADPAPQEAPAWVWPTHGEVTSEYGQRWGRPHEGIDIGGPPGAPVEAAAAGEVTVARSMGGYGRMVQIAHGGGFETAYAHLAAVHVAEGDELAAGERLGAMGCTGSCTGTHLHFEIRRRGTAINPRELLP